MDEKGKLLSADENDFMVDTDNKGEILETNMVYIASLEKLDVFEAQEEDVTLSYDTDAEEDETHVNKEHTSDACENDDLHEFIHGHIRTISRPTEVNIRSETSISATPQLSTNSTDCNNASTSQDHLDMLQNYTTIQS